ncbi:KRAB domain-containing protein 1 [Nannospalax galili]|uniref:KRAB domain-containing protein 1 n=1 Tax=Nannospalax galili TaxID=1026970 RepID=UPI00111C106B|nr:KRAB domain-containing protein 1 [Nannospalax galili]
MGQGVGRGEIKSVTFEDVAVYLTKQEWARLTLAQKDLYKDVMLENFSHMEFIEPSTSKPALITQLELGGEPDFSQPKEALSSGGWKEGLFAAYITKLRKYADLVERLVHEMKANIDSSQRFGDNRKKA